MATSMNSILVNTEQRDSYCVIMGQVYIASAVRPREIEICYRSLAEKAMAPHSSILAWKIPWTEEPGGPQSMGSLRVAHD